MKTGDAVKTDSAKVRSFIAVSLDDPLRESIGALVSVLKRGGADVKWVNPGNLHLTLKFLGYIDEARVDDVSRRVAEVAGRHPAFSFSVLGSGAFPDAKRPRVIWVGLRDYDRLIAIYKDLEAALVLEGFERESRPFSPHVTIGRVRSPRGIDKLMPELVKYKEYFFGQQRAEGILLMRSVLRPDGPQYSILQDAPLRRE